MNRDHSRVDDPNYFIGLWLYTNLIEYLGKYFTKLNITQVFHRRPLTASNDGKLLSLSRFSSWFHHWMGFLLWNIFVSGTEVYHSNWLRLKNKARLVGFYLQKKKKKNRSPNQFHLFWLTHKNFHPRTRGPRKSSATLEPKPGSCQTSCRGYFHKKSVCWAAAHLNSSSHLRGFAI